MIYAILFFIFLISTFIIFDGLLRKEYREHYDLWQMDGKPFGMFWVPQESKGFFLPKFTSQRARGRLMSSWLFQTPLWLKDDQKGLWLIKILRLCMVGAFISWLLAVLQMFFK